MSPNCDNMHEEVARSSDAIPISEAGPRPSEMAIMLWCLAVAGREADVAGLVLFALLVDAVEAICVFEWLL